MKNLKCLLGFHDWVALYPTDEQIARAYAAGYTVPKSGGPWMQYRSYDDHRDFICSRPECLKKQLNFDKFFDECERVEILRRAHSNTKK